MVLLRIALESFLVFVLLLRPGFALFAPLFPEFSLGLRLALSWLGASLAAMLWQMAGHALLPAWAAGLSGISWALIALLLPFCLRQGNLLVALAAARGEERKGLLLCALVVLIWLALLPLSPYPCQPSLGMGDAPEYYVEARNVARGLPMGHGTFTGDFFGGHLSYLQRQPLLVYVHSLIIQLAGYSLTGLHVILLLSGGLALYVAAELALVGMPRDALSAMVCFFAVVPAHFMLLGIGLLGAATLLGSLAFCLIALDNRLSSRKRAWGISICTIFMILSRPEGSILVSLLMVVLAAFAFATALGKRNTLIALAIAMAVIMVAWAIIPRHFFTVSARGPIANLPILNLRFDPKSDGFCRTDLWWKYNREFCALAFTDGGDGISPVANPHILAEIMDHPLSFLHYVVRAFSENSYSITRAIIGPFWPPSLHRWSLWISLSILVWLPLLLTAMASSQQRLLAAGYALFLFILSAINAGVSDRHWVVATMPLLALAVRAMREKMAISKARQPFTAPAPTGGVAPLRRRRMALGVCFSILMLLEIIWLAQIRVEKYNAQYVPVLMAIERHVPENDTVACGWPPLIACCTGRKAIGCTWLVENLAAIIARHNPRWIAIDSATGRPDNYAWFMGDTGGRLSGYEIVEHNPEKRYIILRRWVP